MDSTVGNRAEPEFNPAEGGEKQAPAPAVKLSRVSEAQLRAAARVQDSRLHGARQEPQQTGP